MKHIKATPFKLANGRWSAKGKDRRVKKIKIGEIIPLQVTTRAGDTWVRDYQLLARGRRGRFLAQQMPGGRVHYDLGGGLTYTDEAG